jgi:endonuclease YncB( thermonuclease family)
MGTFVAFQATGLSPKGKSRGTRPDSVAAKEPDGDSVRPIADTPEEFQQLHRAHLIRPSRDGSVQLRFEGIDAPELHYGTDAQPLGAEARDRLLALLGFEQVKYSNRPSSTTVTAATPASIGGYILSQAADIHGRPISYALRDDAAELTNNTWTHVSNALLEQTLNVKMVDAGLAYYLGYTSTPYAHRRFIRERARAAREQGEGVWAQDTSGDFRLIDQTSIAPGGQLIFPKLFRRCTDYLKDVARGFDGNLSDWMVWVSEGSRQENDRVVLTDGSVVTFSSLLQQRNSHIVFQPDLLTVTFVEQ